MSVSVETTTGGRESREDRSCLRRRSRRGLVLPVVLVILLLLATLSASFVFETQADFSASYAMNDRLQCRLAAEAGVQEVMYLLRTARDTPDEWFSNPEQFDRVLLWKPGVEANDIGRTELLDNQDEELGIAYRFSIVAPNEDIDPEAEEYEPRFGITDESSKLNINTATEEQLLVLIAPLVPEGQEPLALVHALLDWRDEDDEPREFGAESAYYRSLPVAHRAKNAPFDTVDELLMVRGFNGQILYGEDYDRNGMMTENEDDGEINFPVDNEDGILERGLSPYITVYSHEYNVANDNKPRINLLSGIDTIREDLEEIFDSEIVDFLQEAVRKEGTERTRSLADLLEPRIIRNRETPSPITGEDIAVLFDKCTLDPTPEYRGLINVVTAPAKVLQCIPDLPAEKIQSIVEKRRELAGAIKSTTAWLYTEKILDAEQYAAVQGHITARGRQFTIESIGFADHLGVYSRLQVVVNMRGPLAQIIYYRDLTKLGLAYPIRGEEGERDLVLEDA